LNGRCPDGLASPKVAFIRPLKDFGTQRFDIDDLVHDVEKAACHRRD
jgi:hypothetical protein